MSNTLHKPLPAYASVKLIKSNGKFNESIKPKTPLQEAIILLKGKRLHHLSL